VRVPLQFRVDAPSDNRYSNIYSYAQISLSKDLTVTAGLTIDTFDLEDELTRDQVNPKVGLSWNPWRKTYVRMALTRVLSRTLRFNQTLEPTQVAGFNQFFDDILGSDVWRYGAAIDHQVSSDLYLGGEYSERDLRVPRRAPPLDAVLEDWEEEFGRAYIYWTPHRMWACRAEYQFERFDRSRGSAEPAFNEGKVDVKTHRVPLGVNFFHPSGFAAGFQASYIFQTGRFSTAAEGNLPPIIFSDRDDFWVFDTGISYRLPRRRGLVSLGIRNIFDEEFKFQDTDPDDPELIPERLIFAKVTLAF
jgi:hypothetical protein